ncbi:hypothetical protein [Xenorhabdus cabanillasii]|uniref:hypothetical protein n=1 Tax=Xenorhabdus cabanillasii TaxID=351673 RepID=UPI000A026104
MFSEDSKRAFEAGLHRLVKHGVLSRAYKGIYVASKQAAYRDLKRVGRNTHLVERG